MRAKTTDAATTVARSPAALNDNPAPAPAAELPTHGGLYEFDPASKTMRALEGGPAADAADTSATTGEQA